MADTSGQMKHLARSFCALRRLGCKMNAASAGAISPGRYSSFSFDNRAALHDKDYLLHDLDVL